MSNQHGPRFAQETLQGRIRIHNCILFVNSRLSTKASARSNVGKSTLATIHYKDHRAHFTAKIGSADISMISHPSRETQYGMIALSQKGNTCSAKLSFTQSSVSMTTTSEYLPVSGFNVPSLHLSQYFTTTSVPGFTKNKLQPSKQRKSYLTCLRP